MRSYDIKGGTLGFRSLVETSCSESWKFQPRDKWNNKNVYLTIPGPGLWLRRRNKTHASFNKANALSL
jgi:hypothetical protein